MCSCSQLNWMHLDLFKNCRQSRHEIRAFWSLAAQRSPVLLALSAALCMLQAWLTSQGSSYTLGSWGTSKQSTYTPFIFTSRPCSVPGLEVHRDYLEGEHISELTSVLGSAVQLIMCSSAHQHSSSFVLCMDPKILQRTLRFYVIIKECRSFFSTGSSFARLIFLDRLCANFLH